MGKLKTTVLICNHNYGEYLSRAIQSAINQTVPPTIICVVDDCSTDKSWEYISGIGSLSETKYENGIIRLTGLLEGIILEFIRMPECVGPSEARNIGIQCTIDNTDIYAILDADDEMYPRKIEILSKEFTSEKVGVVYADYDIFDVESKTIKTEFKEPYDIFRLYDECIIHSGAFVSKLALEKVADKFGFYDRTMRTCEDWDLWLRISTYFTIKHVAEPLTLVRNHQSNSTNTVSKEIWNYNWSRIRQKHMGEK